MFEAVSATLGIPRRAYFPCVTPLGVDGATRESLFSLVCRTAVNHFVHPYSIAETKIWPIVRHVSPLSEEEFARYWKDGSMSGFGPMAEAWVHGMNELCVRDDLDRLTLIPLKQWLHTYRLGLTYGRYCPMCAEEDLRSALGPYERILWTLPIITACPIHEVRLLDGCQCGGTERRLYFTSGHCRHCNEPFATSPTEPADPRSVDVARRVAELLDAAPAFKHVAPRRDRVAQFLRHAIGAHYNGHYCVFARDFCEPKANVHGWLNSRFTPSFGVLLRLSQFFDVPVYDVILGNCSDTCLQGFEACAPELTEKAKRKTRARIDWNSVREQLERELTEQVARTLTEIAKSLEIAVRTLRRQLPSQCDAITKRSKTRVRNETAAKQNARSGYYLATHARLSHAAGRPVSRRRVLAAISELRFSRDEANLLNRTATERFKSQQTTSE